GDFGVFTIDVGSFIFEKFFDNYGPYDYVLNFSALKHVRSEKDPFTLMRMIEVNVLNVVKMLELSISKGVRKFFCVSTDKATNPVNMMGASKRIMELFLMKYSDKIDISTSRFANVAFSDGSLLDSFLKRVQKKQPIVIPNSVKRYFITPYESAVLCIMSVVLGENLDIFFPKNIVPIDFRSIVERFLDYIGFEPYFCYNEEEARGSMVLVSQRKWPCLISQTDTTGEKEVEEFVDINEEVDYDRFRDIAVTKISYRGQDLQQKLDYFMDSIEKVKSKKGWIKDDFVSIFQNILPEFKHMEKFKYLDEKM
ncbi:MAG: polysaccharide biosynthesis protein, partial [Thermoplasmata archaeon]